MILNHEIVETALKEYAYGIFGRKKIFSSDEKICAKLGLCDEDLWEMIDNVMDQFSIDKPSYEFPAYIDIHENDITFRNLAEWICRST